MQRIPLALLAAPAVLRNPLAAQHAMTDTPSNAMPGRGFTSFLEALRVLAVSKDFSLVTKAFSGLARLAAPEWQSDWGVSFQVDGDPLQEILVYIDRVADGEIRRREPQVIAVQGVFGVGTAKLADLERWLGPWYRDPPEGVKASLASAYFNAKRIHPQATFLLLATTSADYESMLSPSALVSTVSATWHDSRHETSNRPW